MAAGEADPIGGLSGCQLCCGVQDDSPGLIIFRGDAENVNHLKGFVRVERVLNGLTLTRCEVAIYSTGQKSSSSPTPQKARRRWRLMLRIASEFSHEVQPEFL